MEANNSMLYSPSCAYRIFLFSIYEAFYDFQIVSTMYRDQLTWVARFKGVCLIYSAKVIFRAGRLTKETPLVEYVWKAHFTCL